MTTHEDKAAIFVPAIKMPMHLKDAAAILGAEEAPKAALKEAAETLWLGALTRRPGANVAGVRRSVQSFVLAIFSHPDSDVDPREASRLAVQRFTAHQRNDTEKNTPSSSEGSSPVRS